MISSLGPSRVMMGADLSSNVPVEFAKYKALDLEPAVYDKVMGETAEAVFDLKW
jgi:predicted TIM-barrel fold metal-dependent hydrolase